MTDQQAAPKGRQAAFGFIFALSVINAVSFGIMIPVVPRLIKEFAGGDTADAAIWNMTFMVLWGLMQFIIGPILGMMSDRYGRRPVLLLSLAGLGVDFVVMALAPNLWWLLVGRILNGMTASSFATANAYVADVTAPQDRAKVFGWMGSAFSFGFLIGPVIGGPLGDIDLQLPFWVAAGLTFLNLAYGLFVLPESLPPERRAGAFAWAKANPVGSLRLLGSHHELLGLALVLFIFQFAHMVLPSIFVLYTDYRYHWSGTAFAIAFAATGAMGIVVSIFLVGPVVKRIGERGAVLVGCLFGALGFALYGAAPNTFWYIVAMPVFALMGFLMPGLMGLMSRRAPPEEQGRLQGANQSIQGIASIFGPLAFNGVFAWSVHHESRLHQPGLAIWLAGALLGLALLISFFVARPAEPEPLRA
ncbi:MAG: TCR/Tet family MFS transporter [Caulobacter sp.]|nr:TCR/Tet family MFS transporter [Caulobacter sp.]